MKNSKLFKRLTLAFFITLAVVLVGLNVFFSFQQLGKRDVVMVMNNTDRELKVAVETKNASRFFMGSGKKVNDTMYYYICKQGESALKKTAPFQLIQCERNDAIETILKIKNVIGDIKIIDNNGKVIMQLDTMDENRFWAIEETVMTKTMVHILTITNADLKK
jgi:hypothetical protein